MKDSGMGNCQIPTQTVSIVAVDCSNSVCSDEEGRPIPCCRRRMASPRRRQEGDYVWQTWHVMEQWKVSTVFTCDVESCCGSFLTTVHTYTFFKRFVARTCFTILIAMFFLDLSNTYPSRPSVRKSRRSNSVIRNQRYRLRHHDELVIWIMSQSWLNFYGKFEIRWALEQTKQHHCRNSW